MFYLATPAGGIPTSHQMAADLARSDHYVFALFLFVDLLFYLLLIVLILWATYLSNALAYAGEIWQVNSF
jgi:hypothetical protein